jgi:hypothetical protein
MRSLFFVRSVVVTALFVLAVGPIDARCGKERWAVKTGTDTDAGGVDLSTIVPKTVAQLRSLAEPSTKPPKKRANTAEKTVFDVHATLREFKWENNSATGDNDYHLVIEDATGRTFIAEIPNPVCVGSASAFHDAIRDARAAFDHQFTASGSFQTANIPVHLTGVGYFDFAHGQKGSAPNQFEVHPVLSIDFPGAPEAAPAVGPAKATVLRSSNLRRRPTEHSTLRAHLDAGEIVTLLAPEAAGDYMHVETADGAQGWVLAQNLREED